MKEIKDKSYRIVMSDSKDVEDDAEVSSKLMAKLKANFEKIYDEYVKLEPQQKLFFIDRMLMEMLLNSELPVFYINGLLKKAEEFAKNLDGSDLKEEVKSPYKTSYVG